jgi:hypothetical protein
MVQPFDPKTEVAMAADDLATKPVHFSNRVLQVGNP